MSGGISTIRFKRPPIRTTGIRIKGIPSTAERGFLTKALTASPVAAPARAVGQAITRLQSGERDKVPK